MSIEHAATPEPDRRLATIMFTDMVGYSALTQKNEALALELLEEHRGLLRPVFARHGGREIESVGDGFFMEFACALAAARCSIEVQRALFERNGPALPERRIRVRIGLHLGDVVHVGERVHGDGVNIAARIEPLAEPGRICLSEDVARQIQNKLDLPLRKLGKGELKNIQMPVEIYRIVLPWEGRHLSWPERVAFRLRQRRTRRMLAGAALLFVLGVAAAFLWLRLDDRGVGLASRRVAVLPFANMSADPENEYFADGMTEQLISTLSKISGLEVIARTSVMKYKGAAKDIADIGRELRVGTVLEGSVRKADRTIVVTAQLINVSNQAHLWAEEYDRELKDVFAIQRDIARRVTDALRVRLTANERHRVEKKGADDVDTYTLYLKGRHHWNKRSREGFEKAIAFFEQALARNPGEAIAYAGLADAHTFLAIYEYVSPKEAFPKATAAALRALEIDDTLAETHAALAQVKRWYEWDWAGAEREFRRAIALNPSYATAHSGLGYQLVNTGRFDEGIAEGRRALELDPLSLGINHGYGVSLYFARRYDEALEQFRKTLEVEPTYAISRWALGSTYAMKGMHGRAIEEIRRVKDFRPDIVGDLAFSYARLGQRGEALKVLAEMQARSKRERVSPLAFVNAHVGLGETAKALDWFEKAYEDRVPEVTAIKVDPYWDPLRSEPRFTALLKKVGLDR